MLSYHYQPSQETAAAAAAAILPPPPVRPPPDPWADPVAIPLQTLCHEDGDCDDVSAQRWAERVGDRSEEEEEEEEGEQQQQQQQPVVHTRCRCTDIRLQGRQLQQQQQLQGPQEEGHPTRWPSWWDDRTKRTRSRPEPTLPLDSEQLLRMVGPD